MALLAAPPPVRPQAIVAYTIAIQFSEDGADDDGLDTLDGMKEKNPNIQVYYANRAFCHLKMESYGSALSDATKASTEIAWAELGWASTAWAKCAIRRGATC